MSFSMNSYIFGSSSLNLWGSLRLKHYVKNSSHFFSEKYFLLIFLSIISVIFFLFSISLCLSFSEIVSLCQFFKCLYISSTLLGLGVGVLSLLPLREVKKFLILLMVEGYSLAFDSSLTLKGLNLLSSYASCFMPLLNLLKKNC